MDKPAIAYSRFDFGRISAYVMWGVIHKHPVRHYPCGEVACHRDRTLGGSEMEKFLQASS